MTAEGPRIPGMRWIRLLGSGGFADVHLYQQAVPNRPVAVKILHPGVSLEGRAQFSSEADAMAALGDHPNVVTVYEVGYLEEDHRPYMSMQYHPGGSLADQVRKGPMPVKAVVAIGVEVADAVAAAHAEGVLHRDIKPANILLDSRNHPQLGDFGIAARMELAGAEQNAVSPPWAAPEVLAGANGDQVADVYSLAATLWHLLAGRAPFEVPGGDNSAAALSDRTQSGSPTPMGRPDVPPALAALLSRAIHRDRANRPPSAERFAEDLAVAGGGSARANPSLTAARPSTWRPGPASPSLPPAVSKTGPRQGARGGSPLAPQTQPRQPNTSRPPQTGPRTGPQPPVRPPQTQPPPLIRPQQTQPPPPAQPRPSSPPPAPARAADTILRPQETPKAAPPPEPEPTRKAPVLWGVGGLVVAAVVGTVIAMSGDTSDKPTTPPPTTEPRGEEALPPGKVQVTGKRVNSTTVRFEWTYSASMDSDTFFWQTPAGNPSGTVKEPAVEVPAPSSGEVCVQVKVVRASGGAASVAWSEPGCA